MALLFFRETEVMRTADDVMAEPRSGVYGGLPFSAAAASQQESRVAQTPCKRKVAAGEINARATVLRLFSALIAILESKRPENVATPLPCSMPQRMWKVQ